jgi:hypothetical protein
MKMFLNFLLVTSLLANFAIASEDQCVEEFKKDVLQDVAKKLQTSPKNLKIRLLGYETLDSDYDSSEGRVYITPIQAYYDVFLKSENPKTATALTLVEVNGVSSVDEENEENNSCSLYVDGITEIERNEWSSIYDTYL